MRRPPGSNWGDYGAADTAGRLNELTDERVLRAVAEVRTGRRFCCSLPLDYPGGTGVANPTRLAPVIRPVDRRGRPAANYPSSRDREGARGVVNDDFVVLYTQYSTQWDAFGHAGSTFDADGDGVDEVLYYNGRPNPIDVETMATIGLQGRGVMIDLHRKYGHEPVAVTYAMLAEVMREQDVVVESGDIVCLHTGIGQLIVDAAGNPGPATRNAGPGLDGADPELESWARDSGVAVIAADNAAVEVTPALWRVTPSHAVPFHEVCLFKLGIHLGEFWYLTELAQWLQANGRNRFLLTAPALRLRGSVGSPVTPIATV